jgi:beta-glucosidase
VHQRTPTKDVYPGYWDVTVGGVVAAGEGYEDAARRELREELGIAAARLAPVGALRFEDASTRVVGFVFTACYDGDVTLQAEEIGGGRFVALTEAERLIVEERCCPDGIDAFRLYAERSPDANRSRSLTPAPEVWGSLAALPGATPAEVERSVEGLLHALTLDEKVAMLAGAPVTLARLRASARRYNGSPIVAGAVPRLGIPGIRFTDGPRGVVLGASTAFPVSMARGATFDPDLEARVGDVIGVEARAQGANLFAGVCVNLLRHPAWGRAQETYGEDPHLLGEMGAALVRGVQRHLMACVKHYAANSIENSRFWVDVAVDERTLDDVYLPHFRRCIAAGAAAVMSAYNKVNGVLCGHSKALLTDVLKEQWGFDGFVMSDFVLGVRDARAALLGGQDLEMPYRWRFRRLGRLARRGAVPMARIDDAIRRLLRQQVRFARVGEPERYTFAAVAGASHRALAREVAEHAIVLLRNEPVGSGRDPVLPLASGAPLRLAVFGRLASVANIGDRGSSRVRPPHVVTILDGLASHAAGSPWTVADCTRLGAADAAGPARLADVCVVVAGCSHRDEGEFMFTFGGDRSSLRLRAEDEALIEAVAGANPRAVVVLVGGSAFIIERWRRRVPAILMAWYPGMEGGHAVARVLAGSVDPSGRLPLTWPAAEQDLPPFRRWTRRIVYGPLLGYRLAEAAGHRPAFWFGFGLSYTSFELGPAVAGLEGDALVVHVAVRNAGERDGTVVVQLYAATRLGADDRPRRTLCAFQRVDLERGQAVEVVVRVAPALLRDLRGRSDGPLRMWVGPSADPASHQEVGGLGSAGAATA